MLFALGSPSCVGSNGLKSVNPRGFWDLRVLELEPVSSVPPPFLPTPEHSLLAVLHLLCGGHLSLKACQGKVNEQGQQLLARAHTWVSELREGSDKHTYICKPFAAECIVRWAGSVESFLVVVWVVAPWKEWHGGSLEKVFLGGWSSNFKGTEA